MTRPWHTMDGEEVFEKLETSVNGLTDEESKRRLATYGPNELEKPKRISPLKIFTKQFTDILILILLAATVLSVAVGELVDAITISVIVVAAAVLGFTQEYRAERAIEALRRMLSPFATVTRDSEVREVPLREVVPGDVIVLESGDKVPADGRVIEEYRLQADEASLTGESAPVMKQVEALKNEVQVADMRNMVFAGTTITDGKGKAIVVSTGMNTEFGRIARGVAEVGKEKTPLEKRMEGVGKLLSKIMIGVCVFVIIAGSIEEYFIEGMLGLDFALEMVMFGVALAVAAVPEALPAIVTGTLAIGMREMAKKNAIIRRMPAVETLGSTSVICTDKTGTLTKGEMTVRKIYAGKRVFEVTGVGFEPSGEFSVYNRKIDPLDDQILKLLLKGASLCNEARLIRDEEGWHIRGDPTEGALIVAAVKAGLDQRELARDYPRINEIPFSSERKRMTTIHESAGGRIFVFMKGAPEIVLDHCDRVLERGGIRPLRREERREILKFNEEMANNALRVLGIAYKVVEEGGQLDAEENLTFLGLTGMIDPPREEAVEAIRTCKRVEMKPIMITGDQKQTALAIAKEMGIFKEGDLALTGVELESMSDEEFKRIVEKVTVYARVSPLHKLRIVKAWRGRGEVVAMTGDGVNDAPALKQADIGVAMGITGTEVSKEASDMVIADDNFATIVTAVERGRWIYDNIKKYLMFLLQCNLVELIVLGAGVLMGFPLPLLPVQILYINLATDGLPAIALGIGPADPDIMKKPPRNPEEGIFTRDGKLFLTVFPLILSVILLWLFTSSMTHSEALARTRLFLAFVVFELAIALSLRSLRYSVFKVGPGKLLSTAVLVTVIQTVFLIAIPATRQAFRINLPTVMDLELALGLSVLAVISIEVLKRLLKKI